MSSILGLWRRVNKMSNPPIVEKEANPIKFGILGAAKIGPDALITPARSHPGVQVYAIAARDIKKAEEYGKLHGIPKTYGSYQALLDDPDVDVIYNPLPNGLHYEWTIKALQAGKHVLLEKPAANTAEETRKMFEVANAKGLVLLEAVHYRFHPAVQRVKAILQSGEIGPLKSIETHLELPSGIVSQGNIRYDHPLGGGGLMDCGFYALSSMRYFAGNDPTSVISSVSDTTLPAGNVNVTGKIDRKTTALLAFPNDLTGSLQCDLAIPNWLGFIPQFPQWWARIEGENGYVNLNNYAMPTAWHTLTVYDKKTNKTRVEKVYNFDKAQGFKGEDWWTTYRFQLEAFVDKLQGRTPQTWVSEEDSIANMEWIEKIYEKNGLGARPASEFTF